MSQTSRRDFLRLLGVGTAATGLAAGARAAGESLVWTRTVGDGTTLRAVTPDGAGGHVVAGDRGKAGYVAGIDASGDTRWATAKRDRVQTAFADVATRGSRHAVAGVQVGEVQADGYLVLVEDGTVIQDRTYGPQQYNDALHAVAPLSDGYLLAGRTLDPDDRTAVGWVVRTGVAGTETWSRSFDGGQPSVFTDLAVLADGFAFAGHTGDAAWVVETDREGNRRRAATFGDDSGAQRATSIQPAPTGYYVAGYTNAGGGTNGWVMHVDGAQSRVWRRSVGNGEAARVDDLCGPASAPFLAATSSGNGLAVRTTRSGTRWTEPVVDADTLAGVAPASDGAVFVGSRSGSGGSAGVVARIRASEPRTRTEAGGGATDPPAEDTTADEGPADTDAPSSPPGPLNDANGSDSGGVPGFGVPAAAVAAGAAGLAALRRVGDD
jgi:hypothetical protein